MREAVVIVADTHINSKLGLCAPNVISDDGDTYQHNIVQKWLWEAWQKNIIDINKITKTCAKKTVILNGDITDLDEKNRSGQMVSKNPATVMKMVDDVLAPLLKNTNKLIVVRGTEAHSGGSAWSEESLGHRYNSIQNRETQQYAWWHFRGIVSGVKFDVAHHASMGYLPWTYANAAMKLVTETRAEYVDWGDEFPDVIVRAHQHRYCESGTTFSTRGVFLPCWQYKTAYVYRIGKPNSKPHIGSVVFICDNGKYEMIPLLYEPQRSEKWLSV